MSTYETDPLLPGYSRAPEIHDSRPQSISHVGAIGTAQVDEIQAFQLSSEKALDAQRSAFGKFVARCFVGLVLILALLLILRPDSYVTDPSGPGNPHSRPLTVGQRVSKILTNTPLIDGHVDLAILIRFLNDNHIYDTNFTKQFEEGGMPAQVDLPRLKEGKVGGAFWAAYVPCPKNGTDLSTENYAYSVDFTYNQIDLLRRLQSAYPDHFSPSHVDSNNAISYFKEGKLISPIIIEGLHQIGNRISNLRNYHALGVRYATLTHNCHNIYADAALLEIPGGIKVAEPLHNGVSRAGFELVSEMNRLGMIVDISHVSYDTMKDVLGGNPGKWEGSRAPPIFSHSSAYGLCPHPRNVPDDILELVKARNSIVMVNFNPDFISCTSDPDDKGGVPKFYPQNSTLEHVVNHITYIGDLIGYDHVGLGSDFDGIASVPSGLEDVSKFPDLIAELLGRGVSDRDASKVVGGNILRVWKEVDQVAADMRREGVKPLEDNLPHFNFLEDLGLRSGIERIRAL